MNVRRGAESSSLWNVFVVRMFWAGSTNQGYPWWYYWPKLINGITFLHHRIKKISFRMIRECEEAEEDGGAGTGGGTFTPEHPSRRWSPFMITTLWSSRPTWTWRSVSGSRMLEQSQAIVVAGRVEFSNWGHNHGVWRNGWWRILHGGVARTERTCTKVRRH